MSRVTDLAADFVALGKKEDTSPILREMLRILNTREETHSVEKAIGFLEGQLEAILTRVDTRRQAEQEQNRRSSSRCWRPRGWPRQTDNPRDGAVL